MKVKTRNVIDIGVIILITLLTLILIFGYFLPKNCKNPVFQVLLNDADGLIVGSPVYFAGVEAGRVTKIKPEENQALVKFILYYEIADKLPACTDLTVKSTGLAGSRAISITQCENSTAAAMNVHDSVRQNRMDKVQVFIAKEMLNAMNSFSAFLPNDKLIELKEFLREETLTSSAIKTLDSIIKKENNFISGIEKSKTKKFAKKLEKLNNGKDSK